MKMYLSHCWVNAYRVVQVFFGDSFENCYCESLSDLSRVRTQEVETNNLVVVCLVDHNLSIAILRSTMVQVPF
jgi:hypothetical protein